MLCGAFALLTGRAAADGGPIMPLSEVHAGMDCTGLTVVQGTTISQFGVHVIDLVQDPAEGPRILVSVSGPAVDATGVAEGMSGSPIYCADGMGTPRNIGAISEGIGEYGNRVALATPIEQMLGEPVTPPLSAPRFSIRGRPLLGPLAVGGLSPSVLTMLERAGRRAGRIVTAAPSAPTASFPVQQLVPGASVATQYSTGAVPVGAIGTVTYRDGQTVYAFGHALDGAGRRSLLLEDAYVYYVVSNPNVADNTSYKLGAGGHTVGTLTSDTPNAVIGEVGAAPTLVPIDVTARDLDTGTTLTQHTDVADETDVGQPLGSSLVDLVAPLAVAQAATQVYNGPTASESGHMCLTVTLRELDKPLQFCNRYVSTGVAGEGAEVPPALALSASVDATTALGLVDQVQFASLHVTRVAAQITAQRGLHQATILDARAPKHVRPGERVSVRLRVQLYRSGQRTIPLTLRVPSSARGRTIARIESAASSTGGPSAAASALSAALTTALSGTSPSDSSGGGSPPVSLGALRKAFAGVGVYDGLVARFGGAESRHAYRDPNLLITGTARLVFQVAKR
ncbi:MAG TPA: hypothetical protein VMU39_23455 [Solirubrobacteraceae bacterium]|nr:hypothetical protein [Solirubrobacteraceae bacterium]